MRAYLRKQKNNLLRFRKAKPGLYLFGLRRGGTTMVADAFAANRGVYLYNEPCAVLPAHPSYALKSRLLPPAPHSHFFALKGDALQKFGDYFTALGNAQHRELGNGLNPRPPLGIDRVAMKILNAPWMLDWFVDNTDAHLITLLRHPAAQALSVMRQKWQYPTMAYADRLDEIADRFTAEQLAMIPRLLAEGSEWERAVLDWCVTSLPLRTKRPNRVVHALYEDIVLDQAQFVDQVLAQQFELADRDAMLATLRQPSNSSRMTTAATRDAIQDADYARLISSWRDKLDDEMVRSGQAILDTFEITEYAMTAPAPLARGA